MTDQGIETRSRSPIPSQLQHYPNRKKRVIPPMDDADDCRSCLQVDGTIHFYYSRNMEMYEATEAFSCLSQETRLKIFRLLIEYGRDGLVPGKLVEELKIPNNTLSFHLSNMAKAGLVTSSKSGRSVTYFANTDLIENLIGYLQENCCVREAKTKSKTKSERKC